VGVARPKPHPTQLNVQPVPSRSHGRVQPATDPMRPLEQRDIPVGVQLQSAIRDKAAGDTGPTIARSRCSPRAATTFHPDRRPTHSNQSTRPSGNAVGSALHQRGGKVSTPGIASGRTLRQDEVARAAVSDPEIDRGVDGDQPWSLGLKTG
jgi:hypothetical protein